MSESISVPRDDAESIVYFMGDAAGYWTGRDDEFASNALRIRDDIRALLAAAETPEPGYMIKTGDETKLEVLEDGTLRCPTCEASYIPDGLAVPGVDGEPR